SLASDETQTCQIHRVLHCQENTSEIRSKHCYRNLLLGMRSMYTTQIEGCRYSSAISIKKSLFSINCVILNKCFMSYLVVFIDGWKYYQSSLYFISSEMKSWTESRRYCRERAADLIIINNTEEQDFVKIISGTSDSFWIGLTDIEVEGRWKWVDGSTLTSGFWGSTEPNGRANEEDCALNHLPGWADYPCDYMSKWICEKSVFK
uniref:C-type lectin domain-containing protein n=1 Tax=Cyprinus carpio TaxID=7962 RepID=A0A8C1TAZ0_CYPCA